MKNLKIIIIEDEPSICKEIEWLVAQQNVLELAGVAHSVMEAVPLIKASNPNLVLMDIQLTDGTAFDILNQIGDINFQIIFITAYNHFAIKAIKYGALDYLLKPIDEAEFSLAIQRASKENNPLLYNSQLNLVKDIASQKQIDLNTQICIASSDYLQLVKIGDIMLCRSEGAYTEVFTQNQKKIVATKSLKHYEDILPTQWFVRTHQSYIINKLFVDKIHKSGIIMMQNGQEVPVASRRKDMVIEQLINIKG
jgi:two-component system, LytTR family, response regulator